ncbi:MAG: tetratricopeptide repeat protein [Anaerolineae bacterium]|nr:tetratricopeptide repeat protein [Anaerolineae bacterium]
MSVIRSLAPKKCPNCDAPKSLFVDDDRKLTCRLCGWKEGQTEDEKAPAPPQRKKMDWPLSYGTIHPGRVETWTQAKFNSGIDAVRQERYKDAIRSFEQAVDNQRDFLDGHLWLARLHDDPDLKRKHYGVIIAYRPNHEEAVRELMVLNGQLTQEEANRTVEGREQVVVSVDSPVKATADTIKCSECGSDDMRHFEGEPYATCNTCGHRERVGNGDYGMKSFVMSMLKQRGQAAKWDVGKRLLHCNNCSAERTVTAETLNQECPFCGSKQVIVKDALDSFIQPDGLMPFVVDRDYAEDAIWKASESGVEKFKSFFVNNKVKQTLINGVYLPFWYFDTLWNVKRVIRPKSDSTYDSNSLRAIQRSVRTEEINEAENNWPVPAFQSPNPKLVHKLGRFVIDRVQSYDARLLGQHAATIYSTDFQKASLYVRKEVGRLLREQHGTQPFGDEEVTATPMLTSMQFRLVLAPVWVVTIIEEDGDVRPGLVHGQTGKAVLGKAKKPELA